MIKLYLTPILNLICIVVCSVVCVGASNVHAGPDDEAYFRQFLYSKTDIGHDPDYPKFLFWILAAEFPSKFPIGNDQEVILMVDVKLNENGTYLMKYSDGVGKLGGPNWFPRYCAFIEGSWSVIDKSLILVNSSGTPILKGDRLLLSQKNAILFTYLPDFPASDLRGKQSPYVMLQSQTDLPTSCMFPNDPK